jgi:hypothetical protein
VLVATLANSCVVVNVAEAPEETSRLIDEIEGLCAGQDALAATLFV